LRPRWRRGPVRGWGDCATQPQVNWLDFGPVMGIVEPGLEHCADLAIWVFDTGAMNVEVARDSSAVRLVLCRKRHTEQRDKNPVMHPNAIVSSCPAGVD